MKEKQLSILVAFLSLHTWKFLFPYFKFWHLATSFSNQKAMPITAMRYLLGSTL